MEPISTALVAAIAAGVTGGATAVGKKALVDTYDALKGLIKKKIGGNSELVEAVEKLESKPDSAGRQQTVLEEVEASGANQDPDLLAAAEALLEQLKAQPEGERHIQVAQGNFIAQADRGSTASVNVTGQKPDDG